VCKRYRLEIGAYLAWFVRVLMFVTAPVTYPIALLLDRLLGEEPMFFRWVRPREPRHLEVGEGLVLRNGG
jgi:hypothetical protein